MSETAIRDLARYIKSQRNGLDSEDRLANGTELSSYARAKKWRDQDRARVNGMVTALTFILGDPLNVPAAEEFIANISV